MARRAAPFIVLRHLVPVSRSIPCPLFSRYCSVSGGYRDEDMAKKSPFEMISVYGDWRLTQDAMRNPGMDYEHWRVRFDELDRGTTKQQMIDCFVRTLAQVVGSEDEAKKRIYMVQCDPNRPVFGCEVDWETASKIEDIPGVKSVFEDCYVDAKNKDYGGELFVNGEIVQRSPKRQ